MARNEQVRPLARHRTSSDEDDTTPHPKRLNHIKFIKWCACILALLLFLAILIIVLVFTILSVKEPDIRMNGTKVTKLQLFNNSINPKHGLNMSLIADVSVKNPNIASFTYSNTTTTLYYHGIIVGEARGPPGRAKPRRTMRMNVTVDVMTDRILSCPNLTTDMGSGIMTMSSFSRVPGQVNILNLIKKHIVVRMNCTIHINISTQAILEQKCKQKVKLH